MCGWISSQAFVWLWASFGGFHGHQSVQSKIKLSLFDYNPHNMLILWDSLFLSVIGHYGDLSGLLRWEGLGHPRVCASESSREFGAWMPSPILSLWANACFWQALTSCRGPCSSCKMVVSVNKKTSYNKQVNEAPCIPTLVSCAFIYILVVASLMKPHPVTIPSHHVFLSITS